MTPDSTALPRDLVTAEDYDAQGRFLYPGDVEDAMPEGNLAWLLGVYLVESILRLVARSQTDSVHANLPIYYAKDEPRRHVSPDAFFLRGVPYDPRRRSYCLWKTGVAPQVVFEVVSRGSQIKDVEENRARYEALSIPEYYWFDPQTTILTALRLDPKTGRYRKRRPTAQGRYASQALGLEVGLETGSALAGEHGGCLALFHEGSYVEPSLELIARKDEVIAEKDEVIAEKDEVIARLRSEMEELRARLREQGEGSPGGKDA
jgi:Putative restriction endonuclease